MNYYRDPATSEVYAYDDEQVTDGYVKEGLVIMTPAEVDAHINPPKTTEQLRAEIVSRLAQIDAESVRPLRAKLAGTSTDYDDDKLAALDAEALALRAELMGMTKYAGP